METKNCNVCKQDKPLDDFYTDRTRPSGRLYRCKSCHKKYTGSKATLARRRAHAAKPETRHQHWLWCIKSKYGLEPEQWDALLIKQSGRCAACNDPFKPNSKGLHIDHCHDTGRVRGLLCNACNSAEGFLYGDPKRILNLLAYLIEDNDDEISSEIEHWQQARRTACTPITR